MCLIRQKRRLFVDGCNSTAYGGAEPRKRPNLRQWRKGNGKSRVRVAPQTRDVLSGCACVEEKIRK